MMKIDEIHAITSHGIILYSKKFTSSPNNILTALLHLQREKSGCLEPVVQLEGCHVYNVQQQDVVLTAFSFSNLPTLLVVESLSRCLKLCKDFCGDVSAQIFQANLVLIREVFEEIFNDGYMVLGSYEKIKPLVHSEPVKLKSSIETAPGLFGQESVQSSNLSWKLGMSLSSSMQQDTPKSDVYADVLERISASFDSSSTLLNSEINGDVRLRSCVTGNPAIKLTFSDLQFEPVSDGKKGYGKQLYLSGCKFHQNIKKNDLKENCSLVVMPTEGEMVVMSYSVCGEFVQCAPLRLHSTVSSPPDSHDVNLRLCLRGEFRSKVAEALNITTTFHVPTCTKSVSQRLQDIHGQKADYNVDKQTVTWQVPLLTAQSETSAEFRLIGAKSNKEACQFELGPAEMDFELVDYVCSNLQIKGLKCIHPSSTSVPVAKWIRYITKPDSYSFQLC